MNNNNGSVFHLHLKTTATATSNKGAAAAERREESDKRGKDDRYVRPMNLEGRGQQHHSRHLHSMAGTLNNMSNSSRNKKKKKWKAAPASFLPPKGATPFTRDWSVEDVVSVAGRHPVPCAFALSLLFFMGVEYTLLMVPTSSPPFDVGFLVTNPLHRFLAARPALNSVLAALNTAFVGMQTAYILWTLLVERRPRATISALFMFTCRGILGYSTQLPLPQGFLGSGVDFPVGNVSFFLFFSGHVAGSVIASLDMRRMGRHEMARMFDALNLLQGLRLLATRGHYTIDLAVGVGAGFLFDVLAGRYEESKKKKPIVAEEGQTQAACHGCSCQ